MLQGSGFVFDPQFAYAESRRAPLLRRHPPEYLRNRNEWTRFANTSAAYASRRTHIAHTVMAPGFPAQSLALSHPKRWARYMHGPVELKHTPGVTVMNELGLDEEVQAAASIADGS